MKNILMKKVYSALLAATAILALDLPAWGQTNSQPAPVLNIDTGKVTADVQPDAVRINDGRD